MREERHRQRGAPRGRCGLAELPPEDGEVELASTVQVRLDSVAEYVRTLARPCLLVSAALRSSSAQQHDKQTKAKMQRNLNSLLVALRGLSSYIGTNVVSRVHGNLVEIHKT